MAQQDSSDFSAKFSTLNVNAMEFVPSFAYSGAGATSPATTTNTTSSSSSHPSSVTTNNDVSQDGEITAATVAATAAGGGAPTTTASVTPLSSAPSSQQTTPTSAAAPAVPPPPAVADPPVPTAATAPPVTVPPVSMSPPEDRSPQNNDDPADSWDAEKEPDDEETELEEGDNEEVIVKASKKKRPEVEDEDTVKKEHVNVVFIGHVDAGKSTIGGQIMTLTGMIDKRTFEKIQREAREKSRENWAFSWALDTNAEEREEGKTVEIGRAFFETERKHFTILDAPGHKSFVPNMIGGAAQADLAVLVISARKGEFETGFERGGQTREHAMLAKTAGVKHLVVLVNKMDDPTVNWDEGRYNECRDKIMPYLKKLGFSLNKDLTFMPCSGLAGLGLREPIDESICPWYRGSAFIPFIDNLPTLNRRADGPFVMPIADKYKDMGVVVMGKVESGCVKKGQNLMIMPNKIQVAVDQLLSDDCEVTTITPGENVKIKLKGVDEEEISTGFVLCDISNPIKVGKIFDAQVVILEHKSIICAGYSAVMHIHCAAEEITVKALLCLVEKKTGEKSKTRPRFVKQDQVAIMRIECSGSICLETFKEFPQMGRFTLRDENKTIAMGKVLKVIE